MSVLTVTNFHAVPDRMFAVSEGPLSRPPTKALPQPPVELPANHEYTRSVAQVVPLATTNTHRHSRTVSSSTLPVNPFASATKLDFHKRHSYVPPTSTSSTSPRPVHSSSTTSPRPSPKSSAVMQRQGTTGSTTSKATVWCDRAQATDPRLAAQQKAAKQRAVLEVVGNQQRTSTISSGGMVGKIRHGGVAKAPQYTAPNTIGAGVPTRLLAFDMQGEEEQEGRVLGDNSMVHARTGSGKSSINSKYRSGYPRAGVSPPDGGSPAHEGIPEAGETPVADVPQQNYFEPTQKQLDRSDSEESFGELKEMTGPNSKQHAMDQKAQDDLIRRGSVDERTSTMTRQRLFITNPDSD
ncbi:hypothetical protein LTR64_005071 [Lithohypha guttulata]|uniref:uncharacterized protein n=1 Tax=Lithohypha guttulata TaxID=1690604 RepID=UPI002DE0267A|nr:hypothetical protein LTR51_005094 [Lithohypha guttulata]